MKRIVNRRCSGIRGTESEWHTPGSWAFRYLIPALVLLLVVGVTSASDPMTPDPPDEDPPCIGDECDDEEDECEDDDPCCDSAAGGGGGGGGGGGYMVASGGGPGLPPGFVGSGFGFGSPNLRLSPGFSHRFGGFRPPAAKRPAATRAPIYLRYGSVVEQVTDAQLSAATFFWKQSRTYNSQAPGTTQLGGKWVSKNGDLRLVQQGDDVALIVDATSKRVFVSDYMGSHTAPNDSSYVLEDDYMSSEFTLTDTVSGDVLVFYDFSGSHAGMLKEKTTLAWQNASKDGTIYTYDQSDRISQITTPEGQDYNVVFTYSGSAVTKIEVRTGAESTTRIEEIEYTYFDSDVHSSDVGSDGDLVQVRTAKLRSGGAPGTAADWIVRYTQYRYDSSNGQLKAVFEPDAVGRLVEGRTDVADADDALALGDDDDDSGQETYKIKDYASRRFEYYSVNLNTSNSGAGTAQDPKCVTVWNANGENLQNKYGGFNAMEADETEQVYLVQKETIGACSSCGGGSSGVSKHYFYMLNEYATQPTDNTVTWLVVEDTIDGDGNGLYRTVFGLNDSGRKLREAKITDPDGTPQFWCKSWIFVNDTGAKQHRVAEHRTPAAQNVTSSTVDEFLHPVVDGSSANDNSTLNPHAGLIHVFEYSSDGFRAAECVKKGSTGSVYYVSATDYMGGTNENRKHLVTSSYVYPTATTSKTDASRIQTQVAYTFWTGTDVVKTKTTTLPAVPTTQNGSGTSNTLVEYYDSLGRLRWAKDGAGYVTYYSYHPENGQLAYAVRDADSTSLPASADGNSTKWVISTDGSASSNKPTRGAGLGTAIEQVSFSEYDGQGRAVLAAIEDGTDGTILARHYTIYETNRTLEFPYWDTSTSKPTLPIRVQAFDDSGTITEVYQVDPARAASASGKPTGLSSGTDQSHYTRWTRYGYDELTGRKTKEHGYHDIPSSGYGSKDTNYAETVQGYDAAGRLVRLVAPGGSITLAIYDELGREESTWVGTDDIPSSGDWSPTNRSGANMTMIVSYQYDNGSAGGNGNRTKEFHYISDDTEANARVTDCHYDWRNRLVFVVDAEEYSSKATYSRRDLDNLGRTEKSERYYDADDDESFPDDGTVDGGDRLLARSERLYDNLGRAYRVRRYAVDPNDGTVGDALVSDMWFDGAGRTLKRQQLGSEGFQKTEFDGLGRVISRYLSFDTDETAYADAHDLTGDTVVEQAEIDYDASGNLIQAAHFERKHTASGTGVLTTSTARVTYKAAWHDLARRVVCIANYGTNGGTVLSRPATPPTRSDTVLVSSLRYNAAGGLDRVTTPAGREDRKENDDDGRTIKVVQNYNDGNPSTGSEDEDVTAIYAYDSDGNLVAVTFKNATIGDQVTRLIYGTSTGGLTPDVYRNDLVRAILLPDSDDTTSLGNGMDGVYDRVEYQYNRQGEVTTLKDQTGTTHRLDLDRLGRRTHDRITTLGTGVDGAVRRISTSYEIRGSAEKFTSYDNATVGSGNVINEVICERDDFGLLAKEYQEHNGTKDASTPYVGYNVDSSASGGELTKGLRLVSARYPNGRLLHYTYGATSSAADAMNRLDAIKDDNSGVPGSSFAEYSYSGRAYPISVDYPGPDLNYDLDHGTSGEYAGIDRFGRIVDLLWRDYGSSVDAVRLGHAYDRVGNRLYREDSVAAASSEDFDEIYGYDEMNQMTSFDRGNLNASKDGLVSGSLTLAQQWGLDATGNWSRFKEDGNGSGSWQIDQTRTHNVANEVSELSSSSTHISHDACGNSVKIPKPGSWGAHYELTYDAWHRLVRVVDGTATVVENQYDPRNRRVVETRYSAGVLDRTLHLFYDSWQCIEIRCDSSENPDRQYVWGPRYEDDLILRDRDSNSDGSLDERLYAMQDANWNIVSVADSNGAVLERYAYEPFGSRRVLTSSFATRSATSYDWQRGFAGCATDPVTKLVDMRLRCYSPSLGRFLQRDPIGYAGDVNLYRYASNGPVTHTDPFGNQIGGKLPPKPDKGKPRPKPKLPTAEEIKDKLQDVVDMEGLMDALDGMGISLLTAVSIAGWKVIDAAVDGLDKLSSERSCRDWILSVGKITKQAMQAARKGQSDGCDSIMPEPGMPGDYEECVSRMQTPIKQQIVKRIAGALKKKCEEKIKPCLDAWREEQRQRHDREDASRRESYSE